MRYRNKPVMVEAFKWTGDVIQEEDPAWIIEAMKKEWGEVGSVRLQNQGTPEVQIEILTSIGVNFGRRGDFIVRNDKGNIYPCTPHEFEKTYEPTVMNMPKHPCLKIKYDLPIDTVTIEGQKYSGGFFRFLAKAKPGTIFEIIDRDKEVGNLTIKIHRDKMQDVVALKERVKELEKRDGVILVEDGAAHKKKAEKERDEAQADRDKFEAERNLWEEHAIDLGAALEDANARLGDVHDAVSPNAGNRDDAKIDEPARPKGI